MNFHGACIRRRPKYFLHNALKSSFFSYHTRVFFFNIKLITIRQNEVNRVHHLYANADGSLSLQTNRYQEKNDSNKFEKN